MIGNGNYVNVLNFKGKVGKIPSCEQAYFWRILSTWDHCAMVSKSRQFVAKISGFRRQEAMGGILDSVKNV